MQLKHQVLRMYMRNHTNMCVYWSKEIESNESENYHNTKFEAFVEAGCSFSIIRAYYDHQSTTNTRNDDHQYHHSSCVYQFRLHMAPPPQRLSFSKFFLVSLWRNKLSRRCSAQNQGTEGRKFLKTSSLIFGLLLVRVQLRSL